jgi:hypothetical protein
VGTSNSVAEFVGKIDQAGKAIQKVNRDAVNDAALAGKRIIEGSIRTVVPDMRLSGMRNAKVGVRYDIKGSRNPTALMRATGPLHIVENATGAHTIPRAGGRRRRKPKTLLINGSHRRSVRHPGTKGQQPFAKGKAPATPVMTTIIKKRMTKTLIEVFR